MTLEQLKNQRTQVILQRSVAKDTVEKCERALEAMSLAIQALEANLPKPEEIKE